LLFFQRFFKNLFLKVYPEARKLDWHEAQRKCEELGANLATFSTIKQVTELRKISGDNVIYWTGLLVVATAPYPKTPYDLKQD